MPEVIITQKAMKSFDRLPPDIHDIAEKTIKYLMHNEEHFLNPAKIKGSRDLYNGRISNDYRIIYSKENERIYIVDIIKIGAISGVMRRDS